MRLKHKKSFWGKLLLLLATIVIGGVVLSGCYGQSQPKGWSGVTVADNGVYVGSLGGQLQGFDKTTGASLWVNVDAGVLSPDEKVAIYGTPSVGEGMVYIGGYNGRIYAFSTENGALRWVYPRDGNINPIISGVVAYQDRVYVCTAEGEVYALDAANGDPVWSIEIGDRVWSTITVAADTLYIGGFDKKLHAFNIADGSQRWEFEVGSTVMTSPLVDGDTVYFGAFDRHVYALDAGTGNLKWRSETEAGKWFWAEPAVYNGVVYAPSLDGEVYILNADNGLDAASAVDAGGPVDSGPVVVGDKVVIVNEEGRVGAIDTASKMYTVLVNVGGSDQQVLSPLGASENIVYIHAQSSTGDTIYAVNVEARTILWSRPLTTD